VAGDYIVVADAQLAGAVQVGVEAKVERRGNGAEQALQRRFSRSVQEVGTGTLLLPVGWIEADGKCHVWVDVQGMRVTPGVSLVAGLMQVVDASGSYALTGVTASGGDLALSGAALVGTGSCALESDGGNGMILLNSEE
jgi:hypothetical protein